MRFTLTIDSDNAAFEDDPDDELEACLLRVVKDIGRHYADGTATIKDTNGNTVGSWSVTA